MARHLMIVDDEEIIRRILEKLIGNLLESRQGVECEIISAGTGTEAVELFEKLKPELTLMDVEMPELDGISAFYRMKELNSGVPPKTIFITGYADCNDVRKRMERAMQDGAIGFYCKPIRQLDVRSIVESQLLTANTKGQQAGSA